MFCAAVTLKPRRHWHFINYERDRIDPSYFDRLHDGYRHRARYNVEQIAIAEQTLRPVLGIFAGFHDLFVPVVAEGVCRAVIISGPFSTKPLTSQLVCRFWQDLTGRKAAIFEPDFAQYLRAALDAPLFDRVALRTFHEFLELVAKLLAGSDEPAPLLRRIHRLAAVFSKHTPTYSTYRPAEALASKFTNLAHVAEFEAHGSMDFRGRRIRRIPTTALAVMLAEPSRTRDSVELMIKNHEFQIECMSMCEKLPETLAGRLSTYGAFFLTSVEPGRRSAVRAKLDLDDRARAIGSRLERRFRTRVVVGIGRSYPKGMGLNKSLNEAEAAANLGAHLERGTIHYSDHMSLLDETRSMQIYSFARELVKAYAKLAITDVEIAQNRYIREVLLRAGGRLEIARIHLNNTLQELLELTSARAAIDAKGLQHLSAAIARQMEETMNVPELITIFEKSLKDLLQLSSKPSSEASAHLKLEIARRYIQEHSGQSLTLAEVSKQAGFAPTYFSALFKRTTGKGFREYVLAVRLEQARRLLRSSELPVRVVAQECGFGSSVYFFQACKKVFGKTPGQLRDEGDGV